MDKENVIINKAVTHLNKTYEIAEVYLFGSVMGGNFTDDSDIDMALFLKDYDKHSLKDFAKTFFYIQNNISSRIELHFFPAKTEPLTFSQHVRNTGRKVA